MQSWWITCPSVISNFSGWKLFSYRIYSHNNKQQITNKQKKPTQQNTIVKISYLTAIHESFIWMWIKWLSCTVKIYVEYDEYGKGSGAQVSWDWENWDFLID